MKLSAEDLHAIVAEANAAPSVYNTQPARWKFENDAVQVLADPKRFLKISDRDLRGAGISCGAAIEGTVMALTDRGVGITGVEDHWAREASTGLKPAAKILLGGAAEANPLSQHIKNRFTWRGDFRALQLGDMRQLQNWGAQASDVTLVTDTEDIMHLADLNETLNQKCFSNRDHRKELAGYMRLTKRHPMWSADGLNAHSMQLSWLEARRTKLTLSLPIFALANHLGMAAAMTRERTATLSASGVALLHVPEDTSPIDIGRNFYRMWLELTGLGLAVWPMASIADDPDARDRLSAQHNLPDGNRLVSLLRIGGLPTGVAHPPARLSTRQLIVST